MSRANFDLGEFGTGTEALPDDDSLDSKDDVLAVLYADHLAKNRRRLKQELKRRDRYPDANIPELRARKSREFYCIFCIARITRDNDGKELGHMRRSFEKHGFEWDECPFCCERRCSWE